MFHNIALISPISLIAEERLSLHCPHRSCKDVDGSGSLKTCVKNIQILIAMGQRRSRCSEGSFSAWQKHTSDCRHCITPSCSQFIHNLYAIIPNQPIQKINLFLAYTFPDSVGSCTQSTTMQEKRVTVKIPKSVMHHFLLSQVSAFDLHCWHKNLLFHLGIFYIK